MKELYKIDILISRLAAEGFEVILNVILVYEAFYRVSTFIVEVSNIIVETSILEGG